MQVTDEITHIGKNGVMDQTYDSVRKFFTEKEVAQILMQIVIINSWNRLAVATNQIFLKG